MNEQRNNYKQSDTNFGVPSQSLEADAEEIGSSEWFQMAGHRICEEFRGVSRYLCAKVTSRIVVLTPHYARLVLLFISLLQLIHVSREFRCLSVESQAHIEVYTQASPL